MKRRRTSGATELPEGLFARSPRAIAAGLKHAAMSRRRRRGSGFESALSMLEGYLHHRGRRLSTERRDRLEEARIELRALFARTPEGQAPNRPRNKRTVSRRVGSRRASASRSISGGTPP